MSRVTDILLLTSIDEAGITAVQQWLHEHAWTPLVEISAHAGGHKALQCEVWSAAFNYFPTAAFVAALTLITWDAPASVQLLIKEEDEEAFHLRFGISAEGLRDRGRRNDG